MGKNTPRWTPTHAWDDGARTVIEFPPALLIGEAPNVCIITADASRQLVNHHTIHERYYIVDCLVEALELRVRDSKKYDVVQVRRAVS